MSTDSGLARDALLFLAFRARGTGGTGGAFSAGAGTDLRRRPRPPHLLGDVVGFPLIGIAGPAEWIVDQASGNQIRYVLDFKAGKLERQVTTNGKSAKSESFPVAVAGDTFGIRIDISAEHVIVFDGSGKVLDMYKRPNP